MYKSDLFKTALTKLKCDNFSESTWYIKITLFDVNVILK
jgi:hypothetical protein